MALNDKYYCTECGCSEITAMYYGDYNTPHDYSLDEYSVFCTSCESLCRQVATLPELWSMLGDIPVDEDGNIEEPFMTWEVGTDREEIWHWFDEECPRNLHDDLMFPIPEEPKHLTNDERVEKCLSQGPMAGVYVAWAIQLAALQAREMEDEELSKAFCGMVHPQNIRSCLNKLSDIMTGK